MKTRFAAVLAACVMLAAGGLAAFRAAPNRRRFPGEMHRRRPVRPNGDIAGYSTHGTRRSGPEIPKKVADLYAERFDLLRTLFETAPAHARGKDRLLPHFLENRPSGEIVLRQISIGADIAGRHGLVHVPLRDDRRKRPGALQLHVPWGGERWLIVSHHSSAMPEK